MLNRYSEKITDQLNILYIEWGRIEPLTSCIHESPILSKPMFRSERTNVPK